MQIHSGNIQEFLAMIEKKLLRLFIPNDIYKFFVELNIANNLLIKQSNDKNQEKIQIIYPSKIQPTRKNVLDDKSLRLIAGGKTIFRIIQIKKILIKSIH
jgi:hypothetical protein